MGLFDIVDYELKEIEFNIGDIFLIDEYYSLCDVLKDNNIKFKDNELKEYLKVKYKIEL